MEEHSKKAPTEQSAGAFGSHWSLKNLMWPLASPPDLPGYSAACPAITPTLGNGLAAEQLRCSLGSPSILGGTHLTMRPYDTLANSWIISLSLTTQRNTTNRLRI